MAKLFCLVAILCIVSLELSSADQCLTSTIKIEQLPTGHSVGSKPEWKVKVSNTCRCSITLLKFLCPKFVGGVAVNPPVISLDKDGHCVVKRVNPLYSGESFEFTYASDPTQFQVLEINEACS